MAEIAAVDGVTAVAVVDVPVSALYLDDVAVVFVVVHERKQSRCAVHRDVVLGGIAPGDDGNNRFHRKLCICLQKEYI